MEVSKENFDEFTEWLKKDGLVPRKSERLWKKTILTRLLTNDSMTISNFSDFQADKYKAIAHKMVGVKFNELVIHKVILDETLSSVIFVDKNGKTQEYKGMDSLDYFASLLNQKGV
jgi:hypothetical protein